MCLDFIWPLESHKEEDNVSWLLCSLCSVDRVCDRDALPLWTGNNSRGQRNSQTATGRHCGGKNNVYVTVGQDMSACQQTRLHQSRSTLTDLLTDDVT